ncbi:MAG: T9SS type A sorting domain-containing protein [bacterium]
MKAKFIFIAMASILSVGTVSAYIPTIEADTIFRGFASGTVSGIVFTNEGNNVIIMHDGQPVEIDVETRKILREFEAVPNPQAANPDMIIIKSFDYLIATIKSLEIDGKKDFVGSVIWDYNSGKIIKTMRTTYFIKNNGLTYMWNGYQGWNAGKNYIFKYDFTNFQNIDTMSLGVMYQLGGKVSLHIPAIVPYTDKILFSVDVLRDNNYGTYYSIGEYLYLLDFATKESKILKFTNTAPFSEKPFSKILVTETGKYYIAQVGDCIIYDCNFNFLYEINPTDIKDLIGVEKVLEITPITSYFDDYLIINVRLSSQNILVCYNIAEKKIYKYLGFVGTGIYDRETNRLALVNKNGVVAIFDDEITPIKEIPKPPSLEIKYSNNQLEFYSDKSFAGLTQIFNLAGKLVLNLGSQEFINGKNIIPVEQSLSVGVYFFSIENGTEHVSGKFIVD